MAIELNRGTAVVAAVLLAGSLLLGVYWLNRGYGEVSPRTYELSTALYSACMNQNETHLNQVDETLKQVGVAAVPSHERKWLREIIDRAREGNWESAAKSARRIMEDQVQY